MAIVQGLECVLLLRLPGRAVALVSAEVAQLGERMGELRRLGRGDEVTVFRTGGSVFAAVATIGTAAVIAAVSG
jgi:hypothetical protein